MKPLPKEALEEECDFCEAPSGTDCLDWCDCRACTEHRKGAVHGS